MEEVLSQNLVGRLEAAFTAICQYRMRNPVQGILGFPSFVVAHKNPSFFIGRGIFNQPKIDVSLFSISDDNLVLRCNVFCQFRAGASSGIRPQAVHSTPAGKGQVPAFCGLDEDNEGGEHYFCWRSRREMWMTG